MHNPTMRNASAKAGVPVPGGQADVTRKKRLQHSGTANTNKVVREIQGARLRLGGTKADIHLQTLPMVLQRRGDLELSTYDGVAAGYFCMALGIKELKETCNIILQCDDVFGLDDGFYKGVVLYVPTGRQKDSPPVQQSFAMESV